MIKKYVWTMGGLYTFSIVMRLVSPEGDYLFSGMATIAFIIAMSLMFTLPLVMIMSLWKERAVRRGSPPMSQTSEWTIVIFLVPVAIIAMLAFILYFWST